MEKVGIRRRDAVPVGEMAESPFAHASNPLMLLGY